MRPTARAGHRDRAVAARSQAARAERWRLLREDEMVPQLLGVLREELGVEGRLVAPGSTAPEGARSAQAGLPSGALLRLTWSGGEPSPEDAGLARLVAALIDDRSALDAAGLERHRAGDRVRRMLEFPDDPSSLTMVFQPIAHLQSGRVVGVEALARFPGASGTSGPERWFAEAHAAGLGVELQMLALRRALCAIDVLPDDVYLSVNVSPAAAVAPALVEMVLGAPPDRLVLEITEHEAIVDYPLLNRRLEVLRRRGVRLAVDDAGAGFASLRHVLRLAPDIVKLDASLIQDIDDNAAIRALSYSLSVFVSTIGASVDAEGIETERELAALRFLGISHGQGWQLAPPRPLEAAMETLLLQ